MNEAERLWRLRDGVLAWLYDLRVNGKTISQALPESFMAATSWSDTEVTRDELTAAVSARRRNALTGNNTCVTPHPVHRDRRGHSSTGPSGPRNRRRRARPHPASTPPHDGQLSSPATSLHST